VTTKTLKSQTSAATHSGITLCRHSRIPQPQGIPNHHENKHHTIIIPLPLILLGNNDDDCYYLWDTHAKKLALAKVYENSTSELWSKFSIHATSEAQISLCVQDVRKPSPDTTDTMEVVAVAAAAVAAAAAAATAENKFDICCCCCCCC